VTACLVFGEAPPMALPTLYSARSDFGVLPSGAEALMGLVTAVRIVGS
jgi:hypothetical protein